MIVPGRGSAAARLAAPARLAPSTCLAASTRPAASLTCRSASSGRVATSGRAARPRGAASRQLVERAPAREALVDGVPVLDVRLAQPPAEPDRAAGEQCRKVDQPGLDVAELDVQLDQAGDPGLHLVDEALHPKSDPAELLGGLGGRLAVLRCQADRAIPEGDQVLALVAESNQDSLDVRNGRIGL